jgi:hypothetical protein
MKQGFKTQGEAKCGVHIVEKFNLVTTSAWEGCITGVTMDAEIKTTVLTNTSHLNNTMRGMGSFLFLLVCVVFDFCVDCMFRKLYPKPGYRQSTLSMSRADTLASVDVHCAQQRFRSRGTRLPCDERRINIDGT